MIAGVAILAWRADDRAEKERRKRDQEKKSMVIVDLRVFPRNQKKKRRRVSIEPESDENHQKNDEKYNKHGTVCAPKMHSIEIGRIQLELLAVS